MTNINPSELHKSKSNFVNCNKTIDALNKILFQQQLIKCNKQLSNDMLQVLKLILGQEDKNFKLVNKILYKTEMVSDQVSYKLCLPSFVAIDILSNEHLRNNCHLPIKPLTDRFNALFHVPDVHKKASKIIKACLSCLLASTTYKQKKTKRKRHHSRTDVRGGRRLYAS